LYSGRLIPVLLLLGFGLGALPLACGSDNVESPFGPAAGGAGGAGADVGAGGFKLDIDAGDDFDPTLGGPCEDDGHCDDKVACTLDSCDVTLGRCRFQPDDSNCNDRIYCDGALRCDVRDGCVPGEPVSCSDNSTCTIDVCVEATQSCRHDPRDADGDGESTRNCGGDDCDDQDPLANSTVNEICGNAKDDNCDGETDEEACSAPEHDTCADALEITEDGFYDLDLTATSLDYANVCTPRKRGYRDAVVTVVVPEGDPVDIDVTAKLDSGRLVLAPANRCGAISQCQSSFSSPMGGTVNRLILRDKPSGTYPIYVQADVEGIVQLRVERRPAEAHAPELCESAVALSPDGAPVRLRLPAYEDDFRSACAPPPILIDDVVVYPAVSGDAFLTFTLSEARDVTLVADAELGLGQPLVALLDEGCRTELTCRSSQPGRLFERNLPPGTYRVALSGTGPDDVTVRLVTAPVSAPPAGEGCVDAEPLPMGVEQLLTLSTHEDAVQPVDALRPVLPAPCLAGAPDATFELALEERADVGLLGRFSSGDRGAVSIASSDCRASLACEVGGGVLLAVYHGLTAGTHRAIIESEHGNPVGFSRFERPALPTVYVPFADDCQSAVLVPETGGHFVGSTRNAFPDFNGGCDVGGLGEGGAADQILRLRLEEDRRVVLSLQGDFETMLNVRAGEFCPGAEIACALGRNTNRSFLDLDLDAGDYFIQIDGYAGQVGSWELEVFTAPR
jgi:Putative metal-binding motif